jgi:large subunit ribosomal protein L22
MINKYAVQGINEEHSAKARGNYLPVSARFCVEICSFIRKKNLQKAKELMALTIEKKAPIPFKRFVLDLPHRKGMRSGRYPVLACKAILQLLESVEANAQFKGLNTSNLVITHILANKASRPWKYGRHSRRRSKRTNVEIIVVEKAPEKKEKKPEAKKLEAKK